MFVIVKRICHLPLDLALLSIDFVSLTRWRMAGFLASSVGVVGPRTGPFCAKRFRAVDSRGETCSLCSHAHRYGNSFVFSMLCPWIRVVALDGVGCACACSRQRRFSYPSFRYACLGVSLVALWLGVAFSVYRVVA